tara:strand:+ start:1615 stop:2385 length:771 start_codon:yes stop_codon:yes gene_type:complete
VPYLRFSRDKKGFENTYVLHSGKARGKSRPQMLYLFRTPPNIQVGRHPLDAEAIRAVEEHNPDVTFDWKKMLKVKGSLSSESSRQPAHGVRKRSKPRPGVNEVVRRQEPEVRVSDVEVEKVEAPTDLTDENTLNKQDEAVDPQLLEAAAHLSEESGDEGRDETLEVPEEADTEHPVVTLMGYDSLSRLRARYAETQARINEKASSQRDLGSIRKQAEQLNPDRWETIEAAVTGIEQFETNAEAIRAKLGRRPSRPK